MTRRTRTVLAAAWALLATLRGGEALAQATYDYATLGAPKFVNSIYIDLTRLTSVSKFRSNAGHDYSDSTQFGVDGYKDIAYGNRIEACSSMKHYFMNPDSTTAIYAPVSGTISRITTESLGDQIEIVAEAQPAFRFTIFHVVADAPLAVGQRLEAGQRLGHHISSETWSDIAVWVQTPRGKHLISYFEVLTDEAFAQFQARGIAARADMILTRDYRAANLVFSCLGAATFPEPYAALIGAPATLNGGQYLIVAPTYNGAGGSYSYLRFFNNDATAGGFVVTVLGSPSGSSYGTAQISVPSKASLQYALSEILTRAQAPALITGDTSYSLYMERSGAVLGYQHVLYNGVNGVFENLSNCKNWLTIGTASKVLLNVHATTIPAYPSTIQIHNTRASAMNVTLTLRDAASGQYIRFTPETSRYTLAVPANATAAVTVADIQTGLGFTPADGQYHYNVEIADAGGGAADMTAAHYVRNQIIPADLNLTAACSAAP